jgi:hypothetical protein
MDIDNNFNNEIETNDVLKWIDEYLKNHNLSEMKHDQYYKSPKNAELVFNSDKIDWIYY